MNDDIDKHFAAINVDGEELYFPNDIGWAILKRDRTFRGKPLGLEKLFWSTVETCRAYPDLRIGLGKIGKAFDEWRPYVIATLKSKLTRIHLQQVKCSHCGWTGIGGTTAEPDLYIGFGPDFQGKYSNAQQAPACSCPQCDTQMEDHIVWCAVKRTSEF
jgi:hypothetical protein